MNFTEVVVEVMSVVKRPDKLSAARREVNAAISLFAQDGDWSQTFVESLTAINPAELTQSIAMTAFPRLRKFKYIRRAGTKNYLSKLDLANLAKNDCDTRDKYYIAGSNLNISMITTASNLDIGYYQYAPTLSDASPEYWLLEGAWTAVFNRATAKILADIGDPQGASTHERYAVSAWLTFRNNRHLQE